MKRFFIVALAALSLVSCSIVDSSEVGIKFKKFSLTDQGQLKAVPVTGWTFYNPFTTSVYTYPVFVQRVDYPAFSVTTKDAAVFSMDPVLAYQIQRDKAVDIFAKYRKSLHVIEGGYMRTCIYDAYRIVANTYTSDELMANRGEFEEKVREMLSNNLGREGFNVEEFTSQIVPPASLSAAIEAKNQAIQNALKASNQVAEAEANAKIAIAKAKGEAEAMRIKADAEAYYNKTISASLSDLIVKEDFIEKWDGKLPTVQGANGSMLMDMSKLFK